VWGPDTILVPFYRTLTAFNPIDLTKEWVWATRESGWLVLDVLATPSGSVYVLVGKAERSSISGYGVQSSDAMVVKLDGATGQEIQRIPLVAESWMTSERELAIPVAGRSFSWPRPPVFVPLESGLAVSDLRGHLVVLGDADPALRPALRVDGAYPPAGGPVHLVVEPPAGRVATRVLVRWGDGALGETTPGAASGVGAAGFTFRHAFGTPIRHEVLATAVYEDGLTGTATAVIDVGGTPPPDLNVIQQAFAPENQNFTFGILGVLLAVLGGLYAVVLRHRGRLSLRGLLEELEAVYVAHKANPAACQDRLAAERARFRGLLLAGRLDEGQLGVLERRIDELAGKARLAGVDEELSFLPHGMVMALRDMLADGRVSSWERSRFLDSLAATPGLTEAQRAKAASVLETWYGRDRAEASAADP
jgi:hypothetical protein